MTISYLDCGRCGAACVPSDDAGMFWDGQEHRCEECQTLNVVHADPDDGAWIGRWICKHGKDEDTPCPECDAEDEARARRPGSESSDNPKDER